MHSSSAFVFVLDGDEDEDVRKGKAEGVNVGNWGEGFFGEIGDFRIVF